MAQVLLQILSCTGSFSLGLSLPFWYFGNLSSAQAGAREGEGHVCNPAKLQGSLIKSLHNSETPDFRSCMCSLFPRATFIDFVGMYARPPQNT